jgi:peptidoglycan/xylan/chitin deacetylase (PgdA/CDA1 family)
MIRKIAKSAALGLLRSTGAFAAAASSERRRTSLLILCYHGISLRDEHLWEPSLFMTPDLFRHRLEVLRDARANVLPLSEALQRLNAGSLPPRSVALTFDDGFCDFLRHGVPLLRSFLTTHYCRYRVPVFNLVASYTLWKCQQPMFEWPELGLGPMENRTSQDRWTIVSALLKWAECRGLETMEKNDLARRLSQQVGISYEDLGQGALFQILAPEEVASVTRAGFDIQLHTHRHRVPRDPALFLREICENRNSIREFTGRDPLHFCYPSGDYAPEVLPWLRESGVASATTCDVGLARPHSEPLQLPRILDGQQVSRLQFEAWISGLVL